MAGAINFEGLSISVNAEDDNPTNLDISRVYTNEDFPGLVSL